MVPVGQSLLDLEGKFRSQKLLARLSIVLVTVQVPSSHRPSTYAELQDQFSQEKQKSSRGLESVEGD